MEKVIAVRLKDVPIIKRTLQLRVFLLTAYMICLFGLGIIFRLTYIPVIIVPAELFFFYRLSRCGIRWNNLLELERLLIKKAKERSIVKDAGLWRHAKKDEETTPK